MSPFYRNIPIEVEPVAQNGVGRYVTGRLLSHQYYGLTLDRADQKGALQIGATYSCTALTEEGIQTRTHWLYCTALTPKLTFGITRNWSRPQGFAPLWADIEEPLIRLEELTDLVAIFSSPPPALGLAQAQIGRRGWLVTTCIAAPHAMGILVEAPMLPPLFPEGAGNIKISGKCVRTMQSIGFDGLSCVNADDPALFLQEEC